MVLSKAVTNIKHGFFYNFAGNLTRFFTCRDCDVKMTGACFPLARIRSVQQDAAVLEVLCLPRNPVPPLFAFGTVLVCETTTRLIKSGTVCGACKGQAGVASIPLVFAQRSVHDWQNV